MRVNDRIKKNRELKNYTQAYMSEKLGISQNTYSKIETGGIKLTVDRLQQIAEILEIPVEEILAGDKQNFNFYNSNIDKFYAYIEHMQEDNKEMVQSMIGMLNEQVSYLRKENEKLLDIIEKSKEAG